jgi:hypothetical protein
MTAADFGMTRRQMYEAIRLAEVPDDEFERIMALPHREKISAVRYIKSGQWRRGVVDNDAHIRLPRELFDALARHEGPGKKRVGSRSRADRYRFGQTAGRER